MSAADTKFTPIIRRRALARRVLVVANTRAEGKWCAYIDAVPGQNHDDEVAEARRSGTKVSEDVARLLFPEFAEMEYAP